GGHFRSAESQRGNGPEKRKIPRSAPTRACGLHAELRAVPRISASRAGGYHGLGGCDAEDDRARRIGHIGRKGGARLRQGREEKQRSGILGQGGLAKPIRPLALSRATSEELFPTQIPADPAHA